MEENVREEREFTSSQRVHLNICILISGKESITTSLREHLPGERIIHTHTHTHTYRNTHTHTHTHIYIYIYIYANFIKHDRHFMSTYFLLDPFEFPYYFYCILGELIYVLSIVVCIPSTFCPTLGHHQGRIYYKSDVTFVLAYYYCVRASLP